MAPKLFQRVVYVLLGSGLIFLLAACQPSIPPTTGNGTPTSTTTSSTPGATSTTSGDTTPVPTTTTSCPPAGAARAAVMATLALGHHPNIVYIVNQGTSDAPGLGTLKRFDATTGLKTEIINLSSTYISEAQLSADGQWLLFVAISGGQAKLQMVRMDGQGLQTLYCASPEGGASLASALSHVQWSTNQRLIIFSHFNGSRSQIYLLNATGGSIQLELSVSGGVTYKPVTWLDTTRVYLSRQLPDGPADSLYLLDTSRGAPQPESNLTLVYRDNITGNFQPCWSADSSFDGSTAFISTCSEPGNTSHPGTSPDLQQQCCCHHCCTRHYSHNLIIHCRYTGFRLQRSCRSEPEWFMEGQYYRQRSDPFNHNDRYAKFVYAVPVVKCFTRWQPVHPTVLYPQHQYLYNVIWFAQRWHTYNFCIHFWDPVGNCWLDYYVINRAST